MQVASALQPPLLVAHSLMSAVADAHAGVRPMRKAHARGQAPPPCVLLRRPSPALPASSARGHHACCAAPEACYSHPRTCASEAIASEARLASAGAACGSDTAGGVGAAASVVLRTHVDTCISVLKIITVKATLAGVGDGRWHCRPTAPQIAAALPNPPSLSRIVRPMRLSTSFRYASPCRNQAAGGDSR